MQYEATGQEEFWLQEMEHGCRGSGYYHELWSGNGLSRLTDYMTDTERYELASQLAVLKSCPEAISRLLKKSSSVLLAAKVLVISRLLHMKLSQRSRPPPYLESLRNRLGALRRRLLAKVDSHMKGRDLSSNALVEAMCAFSLATSSSPADVLRHFHHARLEAMGEQAREESNRPEGILQAMQLYTNTLKDTRAVFPTLLVQALENLKSTPLFQGQDLHALVELNLDLHKRWMGEDIETFTPYIRLDDLQRSGIEKQLQQWARQAFSSLLDAFRDSLEKLSDPLEVMDLRTRSFELWFSNQHQCTGFEPSKVVDGLRSAFNTRWTSLIQAQTKALEIVGSTIRNIVKGGSPGTPVETQSLWDSSVIFMDISDGGKAFRQEVIARVNGKNEALQVVFDKYTEWLHSAEKIEATIARVQALKWEDVITDIDNDDDLLNDKQVLLSEDDPQWLREQYSDSLQKAFGELEVLLEYVTKENDGRRAGRLDVFLLRSWRDIRQRMPKSYQNHRLGLESIAKLHEMVVKSVLENPMQLAQQRIARASRGGKIPGRPLWEGDPPVPILPSPWAFSLLREVVSSMANIGSDIWSIDATDRLKEELRSSILTRIGELQSRARQPNGHVDELDQTGEDSLDDRGNPELEQTSNSLGSSAEEPESRANPTVKESFTNGEVPEPSARGVSLEVKMQQAFDIVYISHATRTKRSDRTDDAVVSMQSTLVTNLGTTPESKDRMKKGAEDYWKRTSLLFALLA